MEVKLFLFENFSPLRSMLEERWAPNVSFKMDGERLEMRTLLGGRAFEAAWVDDFRFLLTLISGREWLTMEVKRSIRFPLETRFSWRYKLKQSGEFRMCKRMGPHVTDLPRRLP